MYAVGGNLTAVRSVLLAVDTRLTNSVAAVLVLLLFMPALSLGQESWGERRRGGDHFHLRLGNDYHLPAGSTLAGELVVVGGSATLDGTVEDDVTTVGGDITVGPLAIVNGDLDALGGDVEIAPGARINGHVRERHSDWGWRLGDTPGLGIGPRVWGWVSAWLTTIRLSAIFAGGLLLSLLAPGWLRSIGQRVSQTPGWSLVAGGATEVLLTPAIVAVCLILLITIVGIPLLAAVPILVGVVMVLALAGFAAVCRLVGAGLTRRSPPAANGGAIDFIVGFSALCGISLVSQVFLLGPVSASWLAVPLGTLGFAVEFVAWTLGLGAAILAVFSPLPAAVPPLPPRATPGYAQ